MHCPADPTSEDFGWPAEQWDRGVGTVLIVNRGRQPLSIETDNAFGDICQWHITAYISWAFESEDADSIDGQGSTKYRQAVLDQISPENWAKYLGQWRAMKAEAPSTMNAASGRALYPSDGAEDMTKDLDRMGLTEYDSDKPVDKLLHDTGVQRRMASGEQARKCVA